MRKILIPVLILCIISIMNCEEEKNENNIISYDKENVTVTFDTDGNGDNSSVTITFDSKLDPVNIEKEGFSFQGWFLDKGFNKKFDFDKPLKNQMIYQKNITLYAKLSQKLYKVTYNGNGNTTGEFPVDDNLYAEDDILPLLWPWVPKTNVDTPYKENNNFLGYRIIGNVKEIKKPIPNFMGMDALGLRVWYFTLITMGDNDIELKALYTLTD